MANCRPSSAARAHAPANPSANSGTGVGVPPMCTRLIPPAPVASAMWMQSSSVASWGWRKVPSAVVAGGVPGNAVHSPSTKVTRIPVSATRAARSVASPPLRTNRSGVRVTAAKPAAAAAVASSGSSVWRKV
jgi:hypothetical protein